MKVRSHFCRHLFHFFVQIKHVTFGWYIQLCLSAWKLVLQDWFTLRQAWKGSWSSLPLITMLGKSRRWTSKGSNMPFLVTMICLGCSSTGSDLINAATSSAVFHFANYKRDSNMVSRIWSKNCEKHIQYLHFAKYAYMQTDVCLKGV